MFKIAVLLKRAEGKTLAAFTQQWQQGRGPRIAARPGVRRYVQSLAFEFSYRHGEPFCDGLEELWFDTEAAALAFQAEQAGALSDLDPDLLAPTARIIAVREVPIVAGTPVAGASKNVILVERKAGMTRAAFFERWHGQHAAIASRLPGMRRYDQNPVREGAVDGEGCDGLSLVWFDSLEDVKAVTRTPEHALALLDERAFLEHGGNLPIVLMREQVFVCG